MLIFDIETDGLLDRLTMVHCVSLLDDETGDLVVANDHGSAVSLEDGLRRVMEADDICGHNIMAFDIPAVQKVYPWFKPKGKLHDTLIMSRFIFADMRDRDFAWRKRTVRGRDFPGHLIGSHSLESWGLRMGKWKGDYSKEMKEQGLNPWYEWNQDMDDYCAQDALVTQALYQRLTTEGFSQESIDLEHDVRRIVSRQEAYGVLFDEPACWKLVETLSHRRAELEQQLAVAFPPWFSSKGVDHPKRNMKQKVKSDAGTYTLTRTAGCPFTKIELTTFNAGSRHHIANRLHAKYGWKPKEFTDKGTPKIDESVLGALKYPEAILLNEYLLVAKRLGMCAEGKEAWIKAVAEDGHIHGRVNTSGAVTGRMTHSKPNLAQVPKVGSAYGEESRSLFIAPKGKKLVGADASGLELRCLAHYMGRWDGGAYGKVILEGDIHSANQQAAGLPTRDNAKEFVYAWLFGAGDSKIGSIVGKGAREGKRLKDKFLKGLPALAKLKEAVEACVKRGYVIGLDGRKIPIRHKHAALNTLLQGAGAIVMKKALVILDAHLMQRGWEPGVNYEFVLNIHDEFQIECDEEYADMVGQLAVRSIQLAGEHFGFRCPLDAEFKVGNNWAQTH